MKRRVMLMLATSAITAAAQATGSRVSLQDLAAEATKNNQEIIAAQRKYEAARQRPAQESSLPDPMISLGYNSVGSPRPVAGLGTEVLSNVGVTASQAVPFPGKLKLRGEIANAEAQAQFEQYLGVRLAVLSRLKQAYYRLQYTYAASDLLERNRTLLNQLLKVTEVRYSVGKSVQQDVFTAQTQISILETRLVRLEQERRSREAEINSILNRAPGTAIGRPEDVHPADLTATLDELLAQARQNSPALGENQKMIQRSSLAVNLAKRDYYPDMTFNGGYFYMGAMPPMYAFRADFAIPLYFWRKQRAAVQEQVSNLSQARHAYQAAEQTVRAQVQDQFALAQAASKLMKLYTQTVVPQSNLALESSLSSYETGAVDFLTVLNNFTAVLDYEMNYYDEALNYQLALSRLEELTGKSLTD